jgi:abortive infection bacteriophage resistance protein
MMPSNPKPFKTHEEQLGILLRRGMTAVSHDEAIKFLESVNYYRLSGYWYSFRVKAKKSFKQKSNQNKRLDEFKVGTTFDNVVSLYRFDTLLRQATFSALSTIEVSFKTLLGYHLGKIDPLIHLKPEKLHPSAKYPSSRKKAGTNTKHEDWLGYYKRGMGTSKQPFVKHHKKHYGGELPIWVAVEVMTWGTMTHLYDLSPESVRVHIASMFDMSAPQLSSLLEALNYDRNICAHQSRFFNAGLPKPMLLDPGHEIDVCGARRDRAYYHLLMIQHLLKSLGVGDISAIPNVLREYPSVPSMSISNMGAPENWEDNPIWKEDEKEDI